MNKRETKLKMLFKTENSSIAIKNDKLYVLSTKYKDYSPRAIQILPGFQLELGRDIGNFIEALKETRLPVIIKKLIEKNNIAQYQIIRMHTGNVEDKVVANVQCQNNIIKIISFNRALINDGNYRRYNTLSLYNQLALPYDWEMAGYSSRTDQVRRVIAATTLAGNIKVKEEGNRLIAQLVADELKINFNFICNNNGFSKFELSNISI